MYVYTQVLGVHCRIVMHLYEYYVLCRSMSMQRDSLVQWNLQAHAMIILSDISNSFNATNQNTSQSHSHKSSQVADPPCIHIVWEFYFGILSQNHLIIGNILCLQIKKACAKRCRDGKKQHVFSGWHSETDVLFLASNLSGWCFQPRWNICWSTKQTIPQD